MSEVWIHVVKGFTTLGKKQHDSSFPIQKVGLRWWICDKISGANVLDIYGGYGLMYQQVWLKRALQYTSSEDDALKWLRNHDLDYDIYDVDPWGSPWEALDIINYESTKNRIGVVCTDGAVKRESMIRGNIPKIITEKLDITQEKVDLLYKLVGQFKKNLRQKRVAALC